MFVCFKLHTDIYQTTEGALMEPQWKWIIFNAEQLRSHKTTAVIPHHRWYHLYSVSIQGFIPDALNQWCHLKVISFTFLKPGAVCSYTNEKTFFFRFLLKNWVYYKINTALFYFFFHVGEKSCLCESNVSEWSSGPAEECMWLCVQARLHTSINSALTSQQQQEMFMCEIWKNKNSFQDMDTRTHTHTHAHAQISNIKKNNKWAAWVSDRELWVCPLARVCVWELVLDWRGWGFRQTDSHCLLNYLGLGQLSLLSPHNYARTHTHTNLMKTYTWLKDSWQTVSHVHTRMQARARSDKQVCRCFCLQMAADNKHIWI